MALNVQQQQPDAPTPAIDDTAMRAAIGAWVKTLNTVERSAVIDYLLTGDTRLVDAFRPTSKALQMWEFKPFDASLDPAELV